MIEVLVFLGLIVLSGVIFAACYFPLLAISVLCWEMRKTLGVLAFLGIFVLAIFIYQWWNTKDFNKRMELFSRDIEKSSGEKVLQKGVISESWDDGIAWRAAALVKGEDGFISLVCERKPCLFDEIKPLVRGYFQDQGFFVISTPRKDIEKTISWLNSLLSDKGDTLSWEKTEFDPFLQARKQRIYWDLVWISVAVEISLGFFAVSVLGLKESLGVLNQFFS